MDLSPNEQQLFGARHKSIAFEFSQVRRVLGLSGADSYIYKPINFALFQSVLAQTLDYWRSRTPNVTQMVVPPPGESSAQA